jgi:hypothetical protein
METPALPEGDLFYHNAVCIYCRYEGTFFIWRTGIGWKRMAKPPTDVPTW